MTVFLILAGSLTCGFFLYVLLKFHGEHKNLSAHKKNLPEKSNDTDTDLDYMSTEKNAADRYSRIQFGSVHADGIRWAFRTSPKEADTLESGTETWLRREAWVGVTLGVCGLAALFAGLELFNLMVIWSH